MNVRIICVEMSLSQAIFLAFVTTKIVTLNNRLYVDWTRIFFAKESTFSTDYLPLFNGRNSRVVVLKGRILVCCTASWLCERVSPFASRVLGQCLAAIARVCVLCASTTNEMNHQGKVLLFYLIVAARKERLTRKLRIFLLFRYEFGQRFRKSFW